MKKHSKLQQKIIVKRLLKCYEDQVRAGFHKSKNCKRFAPRKVYTKQLKKTADVKTQLDKHGFARCEIQELLESVLVRIGGFV